jgi:hypothetical protein
MDSAVPVLDAQVSINTRFQVLEVVRSPISRAELEEKSAGQRCRKFERHCF